MTRRIDARRHPDFYHWCGETLQIPVYRHDHMWMACPLQLSFYPKEERWDAVDMHAAIRETPYAFIQADAIALLTIEDIVDSSSRASNDAVCD